MAVSRKDVVLQECKSICDKVERYYTPVGNVDQWLLD